MFNHTTGGSYSERLSGSANEKYGLAKSISVMPGDVVTAEVYAKYVDPNSANWTPALTTLMGQITSGTAGVVIDGANYSSSTSSFPFAGLLSTTGSTGGPKAYLNWIVFDRNYVMITGGYQRLSAAPKETGNNVAHELMSSPPIPISQPGYVYIYLSNEETTPVEVYFDDFKVSQTTSPVVSQQDYYPFGLPFSSYSRENSVPNRWKFQSQEHVDDLGLNWDQFKWRNHQPDIGRFFNVDPLASKYVYNSPYAFSENHVTSHIELEGLEKISITVRPVSNGIWGRQFSSWDYKSTSAMMISVDLGKSKISDTNCIGNCGNAKGADLTKNENGSLSLKGVGNFERDGFALFSINITNNINRNGTLNIESTIVTENRAPFEVIMHGTVNDKKEDGFLLNTVSQTIAPIPRGLGNAPKTAEDHTNTDVEVYRTGNKNDADLGYIKNNGAKEYINPTLSDQEKAKKPTIIRQ
ncbi:MAG: hypothetical protein JST14_07180 [Bacteroidetes bacterium]|nr:hypothetical protein [Bacteroidota bacterium]